MCTPGWKWARNIREILHGVYARNLFAVLREEYAHVLRNAKLRGTAKCTCNRHEVYAKREFTRNVVRAHNAHGVDTIVTSCLFGDKFTKQCSRVAHVLLTTQLADSLSALHDLQAAAVYRTWILPGSSVIMDRCITTIMAGRHTDQRSHSPWNSDYEMQGRFVSINCHCKPRHTNIVTTWHTDDGEKVD